jgi:hypothetical protein
VKGFLMAILVSGIIMRTAWGRDPDATRNSDAALKVGMELPMLKGEYLTGRSTLVPDGVRGKIALLALGFTYDSRFAVESWCERFSQEFKTSDGITFFEVPMIGGLARLGKWFIDSGMRKGTPKEKHENVITVYGGVEPWKKRVEYKDPKAAYLILIDRQGIVRWLHSGPFDAAHFANLASLVNQLRPPV